MAQQRLPMLLLSRFLRLDASVRLASLATIASLLCCSVPTHAQTYSTCNPTQGTCPADPALGKSVTVDFTSGSSDQFTTSGAPIYDSNGVALTVAKSGDAPTISSKWYIMFGKVDIVMQGAPGQGIVSSAVLQSDDLDEIDWEIVGNQDDQVQSNYFRKGDTSTSGRGGIHSTTAVDESFKTYTVDWSSTEIAWQVNGVTQRVLTASAAGDQYPQSPMMLKIGVWSGGDSSNPAGTVAWAGGTTDYSKGPFTMYVKSVAVTDYSTGTSYAYSGTTGDWTSIKAEGGSISGGPSTVDTAAPAVTSVTNGAVPWDGTHRDTTSTYSTPDVWPWVTTGTATTMATAAVTNTDYPGLPSGWTVNASGKVVPPSSAATTVHVSFCVALVVSCSFAVGFALGF